MENRGAGGGPERRMMDRRGGTGTAISATRAVLSVLPGNHRTPSSVRNLL